MDQETVTFEPPPTTFLRRWWPVVLPIAAAAAISIFGVTLSVPPPRPSPDPFARAWEEVPWGIALSTAPLAVSLLLFLPIGFSAPVAGPAITSSRSAPT